MIENNVMQWKGTRNLKHWLDLIQMKSHEMSDSKSQGLSTDRHKILRIVT